VSPSTISAIEVSHSRRPLTATFRTALREVRELEVVEVVVHLRGARSGYAEVVPTPPITGETAGSIEAALSGPLSAAVVGLPLEERELAWRLAERALLGNQSAKCALDLALHDARCAASGVRLEVSLGTTRDRVRTDVTVSLDDPLEMGVEAARRVREGFDILKMKVGGDPALDLARIEAVRHAVGDAVALRLDANQGWSVRGALEVLEKLHASSARVELVEQPVAAHDLKAMAAVTARSPYPVLADESVHVASDVVRIAEIGGADLVNVKLATGGGLLGAAEVSAAARACGLGVIVGSMLEPSSTLAAAVALAASLDEGPVHDLDAALWSGVDERLIYEAPYVALTDATDRGNR
jgi:L-alanine-DL-glutamate epimerase-like enolase superfamily enzyme